jgi:hypothetical protein
MRDNLQMSRLIISIFLCCWLMLFGFLGCTDPETKQARALVAMPSEQRRRALSELSPNRQLDVYLYAATKVEPGLLLTDELAGNWRAILPGLKERLASETDETRLSPLILILVAISSTQCSLAERSDILTVASQAVAKMSHRRRQLGEEQLRAVAHPGKQLAPCK